MSSATNKHQIPVLLDLYRPALVPRPNVHLQVLLRRAKQHRQDIDDKIIQLLPSDQQSEIAGWVSENEQFIHEAKLRMKICLDQLEDHVRLHPETHIKADVEVLRVQYRFFHRIFGDATLKDTQCTIPA